MQQNNSRQIFFSLIKASVFLGVGTMIGFLLGLAYASHLYGSPPVVTQIQNWLAGDSLYEAPLPVDISGNLANGPISIIPKIGACIGFAMSTSILCSSIFIRMLAGGAKKIVKGAEEE